MARLFSKLVSGRGAWKGGALYLAVAVLVFAGAVFLLFRGRSAGPKEAAAAGLPVTPVVAASEPAPRLAVDTESRPEPPVESPVESAVQAPAPRPVAVPPTGGLPAAVAAPSPAEAQAGAAIAEAMALLHAQPSDTIAARNKLNQTLSMSLTPQQRQTVKTEMAKLAESWLFGPAAFAGDTLCDTYLVKRGEQLGVIGRRMKVPHEFLMQINHIPRPEALQAGRPLKVVKGPFHAKVYRSTFALDLYLQDTYVRSFKVGLGKTGHETPVGVWRVQEGGKLVRPTWTDPDTQRVYKASDPDYPLGSRWIALEGVSGAAQGRTGFAIHGTKDPEQIGTAGSRGCIRMYNEDVVLVYIQLVPLYSQVEVLE
jgi:lipoprotein-anchoring transpeptidase ErfK/SrfK